MMKAGSCAAGHREPGQVRKEAALSGLHPGAVGQPGWSQPPGLRRTHYIRRRVHGCFAGKALLPQNSGEFDDELREVARSTQRMRAQTLVRFSSGFCQAELQASPTRYGKEAREFPYSRNPGRL